MFEHADALPVDLPWVKMYMAANITIIRASATAMTTTMSVMEPASFLPLPPLPAALGPPHSGVRGAVTGVKLEPAEPGVVLVVPALHVLLAVVPSSAVVVVVVVVEEEGRVREVVDDDDVAELVVVVAVVVFTHSVSKCLVAGCRKPCPQATHRRSVVWLPACCMR